MKAEVIKLYSIFLTSQIQPYIFIHIFASENIFFKYILYLINNFLAVYYFLYNKHELERIFR